MNEDDIFRWQDEARRNLSAASGKSVRANLSRKLPATAIRSADLLRSATPLFSKAGYATAILWSQVLQGRDAGQLFEETLDRLYTNPVLIEDKALWVLVQVLLRAQQQFTSKSCSAPTKEETLSGELLSAIMSHADIWAEKGERLLNQANARLQIARIDLQLGHREGETGGDFGLIVEYERNGKIFYLPLIFQAKRYDGTTADISRSHKTRGFQYATLRGQKCAAAYLFYNNGKVKITDNIPPLAKSVQDTAPPSVNTHTNVGEKTYDFFSFVMKAIAGGSDFPTAEDEERALSMIISTAPLDELIAIVALGRLDGTQARYESAFTNVTTGYAPDNDTDPDDPWTGNKNRPT